MTPTFPKLDLTASIGHDMAVRTSFPESYTSHSPYISTTIFQSGGVDDSAYFPAQSLNLSIKGVEELHKFLGDVLLEYKKRTTQPEPQPGNAAS